MSAAIAPTTNGRPTPEPPLPLTKRALSSWLRWTEAGADERARRAVAQQADLHPRECAALDRLRANLEAAGPQRHWPEVSLNSAVGFRVRDGLLDGLLAGLMLAPEDTSRFLAAIRPQTHAVQASVAAALRPRIGPEPNAHEIHARRAHPRYVPAKAPPPVVLGRDVALSAPRTSVPSAVERILRAIDELGLSLSRPIFFEDKYAIAERADLAPETVTCYLAKARREFRIRIEPETPSRPTVPQRDGDELAARALVLGQARRLSRLVLEQGSENLDFADLEAPLRELVRCVLNWDAAAGGTDG